MVYNFLVPRFPLVDFPISPRAKFLVSRFPLSISRFPPGQFFDFPISLIDFPIPPRAMFSVSLLPISRFPPGPKCYFFLRFPDFPIPPRAKMCKLTTPEQGVLNRGELLMRGGDDLDNWFIF